MTDTSFTNPANWLKGPGVPYDRYTTYDSAPDGDDDLYFTGDVASGDCTIPSQSTSTGQNAFAGIHLLFGTISEVTATVPPAPGVPPPPPSPPPPPMPIAYGGTVTLSNGFSVGTLEVECGNISQGSSSVTSGNGTTLLITSSFDWTGGTLNSNTVAGIIALAPGATGVAEPSFTNPGINGTVKLGSVLTMQGDETNQIGCTFTILSGTYTLTGGGRFVSENLAQFILKGSPYKVLTIDGTQVAGPLVNVKKGSTALVTVVRLANDEQLATIHVKGNELGAMFVNDGTTRITNRVELELGVLDDEKLNTYRQDEATALTQLEAGSEITVHGLGGVSIREGTLEIKNLMSNGNAVVPQPEAVIRTDQNPVDPTKPDGVKTYLSLGKDATLTMPDPLVNELHVLGDFIWDGTVKLAVSRVSDASDMITVTSVVHQFGMGTLSLRWADTSYPFGREVGDAWELVTAGTEITGDPNTVNKPVDPTVKLKVERQMVNHQLVATVTDV